MAYADLTSNQSVEFHIDWYAEQLEKKIDRDVFAYVGQLLYGLDSITRETIESRTSRRDGLAVVLETTGGYIEPVSRMVDVFRHNYSYVEFIIPSYAMSAGTVLAMSGNAIRMDYFSTLGPIDPQVEDRKGNLIPALGYLEKYNKLLEKANEGDASSAELAILLKFDQAELYKYEQDRELSITYLKEWLAKYKFNDWTVTATRNEPVTDEMREQRAEEIAQALNDTNRWHTHGRGITKAVLENDMKLKIDDYGETPELSNLIRSYHGLFVDYMRRRGRGIAVHRPGQLLLVGGE